MPEWVRTLLTVVSSILASSGFWAMVQSHTSKHDANSRLLLGLAHDRIVDLGVRYIRRGYITQDEYENLNDYLYEPYRQRGGNGSAKRVMETVRQLPFQQHGERKEG